MLMGVNHHNMSILIDGQIQDVPPINIPWDCMTSNSQDSQQNILEHDQLLSMTLTKTLQEGEHPEVRILVFTVNLHLSHKISKKNTCTKQFDTFNTHLNSFSSSARAIGGRLSTGVNPSGQFRRCPSDFFTSLMSLRSTFAAVLGSVTCHRQHTVTS